MGKGRYGSYPKKRVYLADMAALTVAFFCALLIRYREAFGQWSSFYDGLYISLLLSMYLIQSLVFLVYDIRNRSIYEMDPIENAAAVFKGRTIVIVFTVIYLYMTQRGELSSRFVLGMLYIMSLVLDYVVRMLLRSSYFRKHPLRTDENVLQIYPPYPSSDEVAELIGKGDHKVVLLHGYGEEDVRTEELIRKTTELGIRTYMGLEIPGYAIRRGIAKDVCGFTCIPVDIRKDRFTVFGVEYAIARTEEAVLHVIRHIRDLSGRYICFSNTHTLVTAREDKEYRDVLNGSAITFADGNPIAKLEQKAGYDGVERVAGPDFMEHMFENTSDGSLSHYFYGSSQKTLDALKESLTGKYPGINIKGMYSPPYRALNESEDLEDVKRINDSGADIVWIGLGAPKQEKWMADHMGRINGVMLGVGAGFDFHAGTINRAPLWMQKVGLEWLYRLFQDPVRLFKRYFVTNLKFYFYLVIEKIKGNS